MQYYFFMKPRNQLFPFFFWEHELYKFVYDMELLLWSTYVVCVISRIEYMHFYSDLCNVIEGYNLLES